MNSSFIVDSTQFKTNIKTDIKLSNNIIILNNDYAMHIYPILQDNKTVLFTTPKIYGEYGTYNNYKLNYVIYNFYISPSISDNKKKLIIHPNSEAKYGNQTNNMSIELINYNLIQTI